MSGSDNKVTNECMDEWEGQMEGTINGSKDRIDGLMERTIDGWMSDNGNEKVLE